MAVLSAAEYNFPNPPANQPQWLALAQAVFNTQAARWDTNHCNGGLRWQIFQWNNGFNYKNSISQACFFNIAARLALYTGNATYAIWANRVWDWMVDTEFMAQDSYYIYDGAHIEDDCTNLTPYQWTYNAGAFLLGAAAMYNYTADSDPNANPVWRERVDGLLHGTAIFFTGDKKDIMTEVACEGVHLCDLDQQSFKAYLSRWLAATTKWAPWTYNYIKSLLDASALAAAQQCTGGGNGRMCGLMWANNSGQWDGTVGVGQQMAAMEVVLGTMIKNLDAPVTNSTGGTSTGNPDAGTEAAGAIDGLSAMDLMRPITKTDVAGAYILTVTTVILLVSSMCFVLQDEREITTRRAGWRNVRGDRASGDNLRLHRRRGMEDNTANQQSNFETWERAMNLDGPSTPPTGVLLRNPSLAPSVSVYSDQGTRPSVTTSRIDDYPNKQPWRRPAREGDYAGAIDPNRGNGAGFGIIDIPTMQQTAAPSSPSRAGGLPRTAGLEDSWSIGARDLTKTKKPLPGKPGLGRRQPARGMGDRKV